VFRDKKSLLMLIGLPVVEIILFGFALTNEIKNAKIVVADFAKDLGSQQIITKMASSGYFNITKSLMNHRQIEAAFREGDIKLAVVIPDHFYEELLHLNTAKIEILADGSDPNTATTLVNYVNSIIADYNSQLLLSAKVPFQIIPEVRMLYNPQLIGAPNFVPGVMAMVLLLICVMMTSVSIVREKELGTMEVLLVSPVPPLMVIISKMIPYLFISLIDLALILLLSVYMLGLPINGSIFLLLGVSLVFIITALSLGLLISTATNTQESAMTVSLLSMMLPTTILGGFMFPIENMPLPLQLLSNVVPARWYYTIIKAVMLKGLGFSYIWKETLILSCMTVVFIFVSLKNFKVRLE
jgi:ABC-2 type transport system permease protein